MHCDTDHSTDLRANGPQVETPWGIFSLTSQQGALRLAAMFAQLRLRWWHLFNKCVFTQPVFQPFAFLILNFAPVPVSLEWKIRVQTLIRKHDKWGYYSWTNSSCFDPNYVFVLTKTHIRPLFWVQLLQLPCGLLTSNVLRNNWKEHKFETTPVAVWFYHHNSGLLGITAEF